MSWKAWFLAQLPKHFSLYNIVLETTGSVPWYAWESLSSLCLDSEIKECQPAIFGVGVWNTVNIESETGNPIALVALQMNT